MGTTTLDNTEYLALIRQIEDANKRVEELQKEIEVVKATPADDKTRDLFEAFQSAKFVVDFAVANLSPEFIRDWPRRSLSHLAECVVRLGGNPRDGERAMIWAEHVRDIEHHEKKRQLRDEAQPSLPAVSDNLTPEIELE